MAFAAMMGDHGGRGDGCSGPKRRSTPEERRRREQERREAEVRYERTVEHWNNRTLLQRIYDAETDTVFGRRVNDVALVGLLTVLTAIVVLPVLLIIIKLAG